MLYFRFTGWENPLNRFYCHRFKPRRTWYQLPAFWYKRISDGHRSSPFWGSPWVCYSFLNEISKLFWRVTNNEFCIFNFSIPVENSGFYKACFDNTFSSFSSKTVAFSFSEESDGSWEKVSNENLAPEEVYEMQIKDIEVWKRSIK